jgi:hypothetical protein
MPFLNYSPYFALSFNVGTIMWNYSNLSSLSLSLSLSHTHTHTHTQELVLQSIGLRNEDGEVFVDSLFQGVQEQSLLQQLR